MFTRTEWESEANRWLLTARKHAVHGGVLICPPGPVSQSGSVSERRVGFPGRPSLLTSTISSGPGELMPHLELVRADHAEALLAFEKKNRAYFAASIPDRGDDYFAEFEARHARLLEMQEAGTDYFHLLVTETGQIVGRFNLVEVKAGSAELGYRMAQEFAGKGWATAAVAEIRELAATGYGLTRLRAKVTLDNPASHRILERNGFVATGELVLNGKPAVTYLCELT